MDKLDQLVVELFDDEPDSIGETTLFADCADWDSLKHVEFVVGLETRYAVDLTPDEIARLTCKRAAREVLAARGLHG